MLYHLNSLSVYNASVTELKQMVADHLVRNKEHYIDFIVAPAFDNTWNTDMHYIPYPVYVYHHYKTLPLEDNLNLITVSRVCEKMHGEKVFVFKPYVTYSTSQSIYCM